MDTVIVIVGATGTGKSQLAIDLSLCLKSLQLESEIISADSMQIYSALPILTNQIEESDRQNIPHHLIGFVEPTQQDFNVQIFTQEAVRLIDSLFTQKKVPIIVGGTHYYVESLLWKNYLVEENYPSHREPEITCNNNDNTGIPLNEETILYDKLIEVDPLMAEKLHPNETRKIKRSLQVFEATGRRHSDIILEKEVAKELRYKACVFWVYCDQVQLDLRLEKRIQTMIQKGLLQELRNFFQQHTEVDFTKGVFQAIGCKEFYQLMKENPDSIPATGLQQCTEKFVQNTRKYSKVQLNWIRKLSTTLKIHKLDATDVSKWTDCVVNPAWIIAKEFLLNPENHSEQPVKAKQSPSTWKRNVCTLCDDRVFVNESQWQSHLKSKGHKSRKRREKNSLTQHPETNNKQPAESLIQNQQHMQNET